MKKFTKTLLVLFLSVLSSASFAADQLVDLEAEMFKAWDSDQPGANVVADPDNCPNSDGTSSPFACDAKFYETVGAGACVYGNTNVYYLWYADLTGTKTMTITGTAGLQLRVLINRPAPGEADADPHGGQTVEINATLDDNGTAEIDLSSYEYVHLNTIKLGWGSPSGVVKTIQLYGSVKAVSGWVDMVNNGDLESDDLESFPVSKDGPNNGDTANDRPAIVTLDGVKCMKVQADDLTSIEEGWTTWSTQFYFKFNEALEEGTQYRLVLDVYADDAANITTSAQGEPRKWHSGFIDGFDVMPDWQTIEREGTVTADQAKEGGFLSVAFDLNNSNKPINFYFKNAHFYVFKEKNALSQFTAGFENDVVCVDLGANTNLKELVKAAGKSVIYDNDCASVKVNGEPTTLLSVEGRNDGKLWIFIEDGYPQEETDKVEVSFKNPADAAQHLTFINGRYEGEDVPDFTDMLCTFTEGLGENYSYLAAAPRLESTDPENGSFNLPLNLREFKAVFSSLANCSKIKATLGNEILTVTPSEGFAKEFTFTRSGEGDLAAGEYILSINNVCPINEYIGEQTDTTIVLNFGPVVVDPNDVAKDMIPATYFAEAVNNSIPVGFKVIADNEEERNSENSYGSGARVFSFADGGDFIKALYYRNNYVSYGEYEGYELDLVEGKTYNLHFNTARWKSSGQWTKFQIIDANGEVEFEKIIENNPDTNGGTGSAVKGSTVFDLSFVPQMSGKYILKWICASNSSGDQGTYNENLLANVYMKYVPNTPGAQETMLLNTALENAKAVLEGNANERYDGAVYDALKALIEKVEAEKSGYTAPSIYKEMAAALDEAAQTMKDHHAACDAYDANIKLAIDTRRQVSTEIVDDKPNPKLKFTATEEFAALVTVVDKYHGSSEWQNAGTDEEPAWQLAYTYDVLKDSEALTAANAELNPINIVTSKMFTVGASKMNVTGYAAINERIRTGIEALKSLGVAEDDEVIVEASKVLGDDDQVAEALKKRIKSIVYGKLKDADNDLFTSVVDGNTLEEVTPTYDMTVFVKNPNIYALDHTTDVAGWEKISGNAFAWSSWNGADNHSSSTLYAEDCAFHPGWHAQATVEQTITDLPAGVYTINARANDNSTESDGSYLYAKLSSTPAVAEGETPDMDLNFAAYAPITNAGWDRVMENVVVADGQLTLGCTWGPTSQAFFDEVRLTLTAPATGFDYAAAYQELATAIETLEGTPAAKVRAIELYDLNGRRVVGAQKGLVIMKQIMSDGSVKAVKVVK